VAARVTPNVRYRKKMKIVDYIFKIIALLVVWCALTFLAVDAIIFMPADWYEFTLCILFLITGIILTITIWCGPEIVNAINKLRDK
jgi:uncharacterized membrane protein